LKKTAIVVLAGLMLATLSLLPSASAQPSPTLTVSYSVKLDQNYALYGTAFQRLDLNLHGDNLASGFPLALRVIFYYDFGAVSGLGSTGNYTLTRGDFGMNTLTVTFPASTTSFNVTVSGAHQDYSVLYRSAAIVPPVSVSMNTAPFGPTSSSMSVEDPPALDIFSVSGRDVSGNTQTVAVGGGHYVTSTLPTTGNVLILYQTADRDLMLYLYVAIVVIAVLWAPFVFRRARGSIMRFLPNATSLALRVLSFFTSRRLLEIFAGVSLAMLGIALIFGPSPVPRVYLAATPATTNVLGPTISTAGFQYLTPANAGDQFNFMSILGNYNLVILADYPPSLSNQGLAANYHIFALTQYAPRQYVTTLKQTYGDTVTLLNNTQQLSSVLNNARFYVPSSNLGLPVSETQYKVAVVAEAFLTFLLVFIAMAYLARVLVERGEEGISAIAEAAFYCTAVFMATTIVFIQTSELLGLPVALHTGISTVESAVGSLGFGGGSRPRQLLGTLGIIFGAAAGARGKMKIDRVGVIAFIGVIGFIAIDPLSLGQAFYQVLVSFSTSETLPAGRFGVENTRGILGSVMHVFGSEISSYFYSSHGSVLFFATALPFAAYSFVRKSTATFLLLFTAFVAPLGFLRVADLNPTESMASAIPGIAVGLVIAAVFFVVSLVETKVRKKLPTI
jgi:hypothetical protein